MKLSVIAHPNSKKPRIEKDMLDALHVYVSEPPLDGKANKAVIDVLSSYYGVSKSRIKLVSGERARNKVFVLD